MKEELSLMVEKFIFLVLLIKNEGILETLRAILEETDMAITEIRKDAFDF